MEKKRKLSLGDKIYIVKMEQGPMILCPTCASGRHEEKGYIIEEVRVEKLEYTCCDDYGYRDIFINKEYVTGNGQDFYYTKKEAQKMASLRNKNWKNIKEKLENKDISIDNYTPVNNPVKGRTLTLYPKKKE